MTAPAGSANTGVALCACVRTSRSRHHRRPRPPRRAPQRRQRAGDGHHGARATPCRSPEGAPLWPGRRVRLPGSRHPAGRLSHQRCVGEARRRPLSGVSDGRPFQGRQQGSHGNAPPKAKPSSGCPRSGRRSSASRSSTWRSRSTRSWSRWRCRARPGWSCWVASSALSPCASSPASSSSSFANTRQSSMARSSSSAGSGIKLLLEYAHQIHWIGWEVPKTISLGAICRHLPRVVPLRSRQGPHVPESPTHS